MKEPHCCDKFGNAEYCLDTPSGLPGHPHPIRTISPGFQLLQQSRQGYKNIQLDQSLPGLEYTSAEASDHRIAVHYKIGPQISSPSSPATFPTLEMSLPVLTTLLETTSLSATVYPFLHQFSLSHLLPLLRREADPTEWYLSTNPFISGLHFSIFFSALVLVFSEINRNYSQVDRLWSLLPMFYIGHFTLFAHMKGLETERLDTLLMFGCLWSVSHPSPGDVGPRMKLIG